MLRTPLLKEPTTQTPYAVYPLYSFGRPKSFRIPNGGCKPPGVMWTFYQQTCIYVMALVISVSQLLGEYCCRDWKTLLCFTASNVD